MNSYVIHQKIKAIANLGCEFEHSGYTFRPYDADRGFSSEEWLAAKLIPAADWHQASTRFRQELLPILDALSVLTQCSFSVIAMSYFVYRINNNDDGTFYLYVAHDRKTVGMSFWDKDQVHDLDRLLTIDNKIALHYFRESNNSSTAKTRLAMLVIAAEALAGQSKKIRICPTCTREETYSSTDRARLEKIVGQQVYERLYVKNHGSLRNRLFHGNVIEDMDVVEVLPSVYDNILDFLKHERGLTTLQKIVAAPRSFSSFDHGGLFVRGNAGIPDLRFAEENWNRQSVLPPVDVPTTY